MIPYSYGIWKPSEGRGHRFESCRVRQRGGLPQGGPPLWRFMAERTPFGIGAVQPRGDPVGRPAGRAVRSLNPIGLAAIHSAIAIIISFAAFRIAWQRPLANIRTARM